MITICLHYTHRNMLILRAKLINYIHISQKKKNSYKGKDIIMRRNYPRCLKMR